MKTNLLCCSVFLLLSCFISEGLRSSTIHQKTEQESHDSFIEILAVFTSSELTGFPGIMTGLNSKDFDPESFFWKLTSEDSLLPDQFREAATPVFYFPAEGLYRLELFTMNPEGGVINIYLTIQITKDEVKILYPEEDRNSLVFSVNEFARPVDVWNTLELTGSSAKPASLFGQPWYLIAGGGLAAAGLTYAFWPDKEDDPPPLLTRDVEVQLVCPMGTIIFPLQNDVGEEIFILSVDGLSQDIGRFQPPHQIVIFDGLRQNLNLTYTVEDKFGQQSSAKIRIQVSLPPLELQNSELTVNAGETAQLNLLENANCSNCNIIYFEQPLSGSFSLDNDLLTYTADQDFGGGFELRFTVEDDCGQQKDAVVTLVVIPLCDLEFSFEKELPDCGLSNGQLELVPNRESDLTYSWEGGESTNLLENIAGGEYRISVTDENNGCEYSLQILVEEKEADYINLIGSHGGNCLSSANAEFEFTSPQQGSLIISISGEKVKEEAEIPIADHLNTSLKELWSALFWESGNYELSVYLQEAGSSCVQMLDFLLEEIPTDPTAADDEYSTASGIPLSGNVLENDLGAGLKVSFYEDAGFGNLIIEENGDFQFETSVDETGEIRIEYELTDSCGYSDRAFLIIEVFPCILEFDLETTDTPCGEAAGKAEIFTDDPDLYQFEWSATGDGTVSEGLAAGQYSVAITETASGCSEVIEFEIKTLPPAAISDSFKVFTNDTLSGNLLLNDIGLNLTIIDFGSLSASLFEVETDGALIFSSTPDFTGSLEFWYLIEDSCGGIDSGQVFIDVLPIICEPEVVIEADTTSCGLAEAMVVLSISADCEYEIIWHDDSAGDTLFNQSAGTYELVIITGGDVFERDTLVFSYTVFEKDPEYIVEVIKRNPNCFENGEIHLELNSGGEGEFQVIVEGPSGIDTLLSFENLLTLGGMIDLIAGEYLLSVRDLSLDCELSDSLLIFLEEEPLTIELVNDSITLFSGRGITLDLFDNDTGTALKLTEIENPPFGTLILAEDGKGSYSVALPDHGFFEIEYIATDTCGQQSTALLVIEVVLPPCDFEVDFEKTDTDCGYQNGSVLTTISPAGQYSFLWSNGAENKDIFGLTAGVYTLTVTDELRLCSLEFTVEIAEKPSNWILDLMVIPDGCAEEPDIILELFAPNNDQLNLVINGGAYNNFQLTVPSGTVSLNEYVVLEAGVYFLDVLPAGSQSYCKETTSAQISFSPNPVSFTVTNILPPSSPLSSNGQISIEIQGGFPDYDLYLNGEYYSTTFQTTFTFSNLSQGNYEIEVIDALHCSSGKQEVNLFISGSFWMKQNIPTLRKLEPRPGKLHDLLVLQEWTLAEDSEVIYDHREFMSIGLGWRLRTNWNAELQINRSTGFSLNQVQSSSFWMDQRKQTAIQISASKHFPLIDQMHMVFGLGTTMLTQHRELSFQGFQFQNYFSHKSRDFAPLFKGGVKWDINNQTSFESGLTLEYFLRQKQLLYILDARLKYEF